ncbi:YqaJ viral recombinase family nuclease [Actinomadura litoris]|uniref:YqaJ viral recombinase family nuclease n=1 Tax=Actinomadura litoris TaxID=2678616 RepID=UPI001FA6F9D5|nr:YqaJ viral recombinase family protein [Actinomadura litoris]
MDALTAVPFKVIVPAGADRIPWLEARRAGIGSSDPADILGVGGASAQHVYYDKIGALPLEDDNAGEAAFWGTRDEATTADVWAERNRSVVRRIGLIARKDTPWQMCTLDRQVRECPLRKDGAREICALEVKHRNAFVAGKWKRSIPDDVLAQVLWQIHVTGYSHIHVACRIGGIDYRQYVIWRKDHAELLEDVVTAVTRFWVGNVLARRVPALTGQENAERMLDLFEQLHPDRDGIAALDGPQAVQAEELLREYEFQRLIVKRAKQAQDAAKTRLIELLDDTEGAVLWARHTRAWGWDSTTKDGEPLVKTSIDMNALAEQYPDAYAACVRMKPVRRFAVGREHRLNEADLDRYEKGDGADAVSA